MTTRHALLQTGPLMPALEAALASSYDVHPLWKEADRAAFLAADGARFDGIVTSARVGVDAALIDALPRLRVISSFGVGYETIDVAAAARRGVTVGYTPDVLTDCVADLAFGMLIDVSRGISAADRFVRRGGWATGQFPLQRRVAGKRLGIVGLGRIGQAVAERGAGFRMEVRYFGRRAVPGSRYAFEPSLLALATWADVLVLTVAGGAATRRMIDASVLAALGPQGFLVNVARGTVVDEPALVEALRTGGIAGAALDVFEHEPSVPEALFGLDNVVLLPHVASGTFETRQAMADLVLENLRRFFVDGRVHAPVPAMPGAVPRA